LRNYDSGSTIGYRIIGPSAGDFVLSRDDSGWLWYDSASGYDIWRVVAF